MGLVLGAGGVRGGAWHAGALAALERVTGWNPNTASHIVGTSAGAVFAALTAGGVRPQESLSPTDSVLAELADPRAYRLRLGAGRAAVRPGSWELTLAALRSDTGGGLLKAAGGLLPRGSVSPAPIRRAVRRVAPAGWTRHRNCWIVACDYRTGARVVFGKAGAPPAELADAVAASCAVPGFFRPVRAGGRVCVDGGLHSFNNLDLLAGAGLDLVVCLSPMSARYDEPGWHPGHLLGEAVRRAAGQQVDREVADLVRGGTQVLLLEPTAYDLALMGDNLMATRHLPAVAFLAQRSVTRQLLDRNAAPALRLLRGRPVRRSA